MAYIRLNRTLLIPNLETTQLQHLKKITKYGSYKNYTVQILYNSEQVNQWTTSNQGMNQKPDKMSNVGRRNLLTIIQYNTTIILQYYNVIQKCTVT